MLGVAEVTGTKFSRSFTNVLKLSIFQKTPPTTSTQEGCGILLHCLKCRTPEVCPVCNTIRWHKVSPENIRKCWAHHEPVASVYWIRGEGDSVRGLLKAMWNLTH